jgi:hypothetical protein
VEIAVSVLALSVLRKLNFILTFILFLRSIIDTVVENLSGKGASNIKCLFIQILEILAMHSPFATK